MDPHLFEAVPDALVIVTLLEAAVPPTDALDSQESEEKQR